MTEKKMMTLSSQGRRLGAYLIDQIVPAILSIILTVAVVRMATGISYYSSMYSMYGIDEETMMNQLAEYSAQSALTIFVCSILLLVFLAIEIFFYTRSQSIGKAILGMRVVNNVNGQPIGVWWMLLRELVVKNASIICFGLGFIWILIDSKNRSWHDKILDTYVVDIDKLATPVAKADEPEQQTNDVKED